MKLACLATCVFLSGCSPVININVLPVEGPLKAQPVFTDDSPGHARIAMIDVRGLIVDSRTPGLILDGANPVDRFVRQLELAEKDSSIKALIVRINSPGGTVTGSDIMYQELRQFRERTGKPVVASLGEIAASGGYYVAIGADRIVAQPTCVTASIGVIMPTFNFSEGMAKIGITSRSIKSGANKDLANPFEPMRDSQFVVLQTMVDGYYARFQSLVIERRPGLKKERVQEATDGRIVTGEVAMDWGLVDELGGVRESFDAAKKLAGLPGATLVKYTGGGVSQASVYSGAMAPPTGGSQLNVLQVNLAGGPGGIGAAAESSGFYYLWSPN